MSSLWFAQNWAKGRMFLSSTVPTMPRTHFNYGELGIAALGLIGATVMASQSILTGQETVSVYTLVLGYVFGRAKN